jgi:hypothetical protein
MMTERTFDTGTVSINWAEGPTSGPRVPDLLPLDGVVSRATVTLRGRTLRFETAAGSHPS